MATASTHKKKSNAIIIFYYFSPWEINLRSLCGVMHKVLTWNYTKIQFNDDDETADEGGWLVGCEG